MCVSKGCYYWESPIYIFLNVFLKHLIINSGERSEISSVIQNGAISFITLLWQQRSPHIVYFDINLICVFVTLIHCVVSKVFLILSLWVLDRISALFKISSWKETRKVLFWNLYNWLLTAHSLFFDSNENLSKLIIFKMCSCDRILVFFRSFILVKINSFVIFIFYHSFRNIISVGVSIQIKNQLIRKKFMIVSKVIVN